MAIDINYSPEQHDGISPSMTFIWWCEKCLAYHDGQYECPYEDYEFCPHCGQIIKKED